MTIEVVMRRPQSSEYNSVRALVETVANETFTDRYLAQILNCTQVPPAGDLSANLLGPPPSLPLNT